MDHRQQRRLHHKTEQRRPYRPYRRHRSRSVPCVQGTLEATVSSVANGLNLVLDLPGTALPTTISLHNAAGQAIWSSTREAVHGRMNLLAETGPVCDGLYILSVRQGERSLTKRVVR